MTDNSTTDHMTELDRRMEGSPLQRFIGRDTVVIWNGSATFNVYATTGETIDCFTVYGDDNGGPCSWDQAVAAIDSYRDDVFGREY